MQGRKEKEDFTDSEYEFCPHCEANLTLQKGYSPKLLFWNCRGCGEMLINPELEIEDDIAWICDGCGAMLNIQKGFTGEAAEWKCRECGYKNRLDPGEIYMCAPFIKGAVDVQNSGGFIGSHIFVERPYCRKTDYGHCE